MNSAPLVVLFGISGVGKTYLSRMISRARPDILRLNAGVLLRDALKADPEQLRTADRNVILANQRLLTEALRRARSGRCEQTVLLEAHSVLDNDRELIEVPFEIIRALEIAGVILIEEQVIFIKRRREIDERPRPDRNLRELDNQQQLSSVIAYKYAVALDVPFIKISSGNKLIALNFICEIERSHRDNLSS